MFHLDANYTLCLTGEISDALNRNQRGLLLLQHIFRIQIPRRTGVTAETFVHVFAVNFVGDEQVFVWGVRVNAELGKVGKETFAGIAQVMRK
jgi:hypothetical protein